MNDNVKDKVKPQIGVAYIRESTEEQDKGYSPDNQIRTIKKYAEDHNIKLIDTYKDLITGTDANLRHDFQRMIEDAKAGKFEVILIFHSSRFARNMEEAKKYKRQLRNGMGINICSVTQHFGNDWNDPSVFLNETVNEMFDEYYSKQLAFWVSKSLAEKRRQGYQNGSVPYGYYKKKLGHDEEKNRPIYSKQWQVHKKEAEMVKKMFNWYSTGKYSLPDIAVKANKLGAKTKAGNPFTYSSLKDMLHNPVYMGYVFSPKDKEHPLLPGKHARIIPEKLFKKVAMTFKERRKGFGRPVAQHRFYLLQGLVYCKNCFRHAKDKEHDYSPLLPKMSSQYFTWKTTEYTAYCCKFKKENRSCTQKNIRCHVIDKQITDIMSRFDIPPDIRDLTIQKLEELLNKFSTQPKDFDMIESLMKKKKKLMTIFTNTDQLSEDEYFKKVEILEEQMKQYEGEELGMDMSRVKMSEYLKQTSQFLADFSKFWSDMADYDKRIWIQSTIRRVWVKNDKVEAIEPTERFKPLFVTQALVNALSPSATPAKFMHRYACFLFTLIVIKNFKML